MAGNCFVCPNGQGKMCGGGCGLCEVCSGEAPQTQLELFGQKDIDTDQELGYTTQA